MQLQKLNRNNNNTISKPNLIKTINQRVDESREMLVKALNTKNTISKLNPQLENIKPDELKRQSTDLQSKIQVDEKKATALTTSITDKKNIILQLTDKLYLDNGNTLKAESSTNDAPKLNIASVNRTSSSTNTIPREKTDFIGRNRKLITELLNQQNNDKFANLKTRYENPNARVLITLKEDADLIKQLFEESIKADSNQLEAVKTQIASHTQSKTDIDFKIQNYETIQNSISKAETDINTATANLNKLNINYILKRISNTNLSSTSEA